MIVVFAVLWNFTQGFSEECYVWKCRDRPDRPTCTTLTEKNYKVFDKFYEQFNKAEIFNDEFYFKIC